MSCFRIGSICFMFISFLLAACSVVPVCHAQETGTGSMAAVPNMVSFSGDVADVAGKPAAGIVGVSFFLYREPQGGAPLWMETQNVRPDQAGHYSVMLGSTTNRGLAADLFASGEARWLGVQVAGQAEQPRVLLLSVPYALKAADAETLGGLPLSAFVLAAPPGAASPPAAARDSESTAVLAPALSGTGTADFLPLWTNGTTLGSSVLFQSGTGSTAKVGINTMTPTTPLDVKGAATVRGNLGLSATGVATATAGKNSQPMSFTASVFNSGSTLPVNENFRWQAEPVGNNTATATGSLNLLSAQGTGAYAETGLKLGHNGVITFAAGQKFPGTGAGTITRVTAGTALTGGGASGNVTLNLDTTKVPVLNGDNTFSGTENINGNVLASGTVEGQNAGFRGNLSGAILSARQDSTSGPDITVISSGVGIEINSDQLGVYSIVNNSTSIYGLTGSAGESGVYGDTTGQGGFGVYASNRSSAGQALWAETHATGSANGVGPDGVHGVSHAGNGSGVAGTNDAAGGNGIYGAVYGSATYAGRFDGNVFVNGTLSKNGGSFKIDHPLDPANKYLSHSFVESPDMKNFYDGVATLDAAGESVVRMPDWFGALNRDFRYQLTCIGGFAPVYIAQEIHHNEFKISGGRPGMKVSWQVTGTRQDAWANAHRIPVEEVKPGDERGTYLHPELFGAPKQSGLSWRRFGYPDNVKGINPERRPAPAMPVKDFGQAKPGTGR